jgi:WD40 repeat protein
VRSLAFSPDGQHFAVLTEADLQLYRTAQPGIGQRLLHSQPSPMQSSQPQQAGRSAQPGRDSNVAWAPDDARLAASLRDRLLRVWRPDGQMIVILGGCGEALVLAWSPDGNTLAAGSQDHTVCLWR